MKRWLCAIMVFLLLQCSVSSSFAAITGDVNGDGIISYEEYGEQVSMIQTRLRELGYFMFKPTGKFQSLTRTCTIAFQSNQTDENGAPIIADGTVGEQSLSILFSTGALRAPIGQNVRFPALQKATGTQKEIGQRVNWETVKNKLVVGLHYQMMDFQTGATFEMIFTGGEQHAEMECASATDTTAYKSLYGGEFNYYKRPMLVQLNGEWVACSLQGQPHGEDTVSSNDMDGHACLFFDGSRSHVGGLADVEHVSNINTAAGQ